MPYRNLTELQTACQRKQKLKYLFFWGHTPTRAGEIDKAVFSQWYPAPFTLDGVRYATAEHYMMAEKAALFADRTAYDASGAVIEHGAHLYRASRYSFETKLFSA